MNPDRRSAVLTGTFFIIGTVGGAGGRVVLAPLLGATDYLRAYGTMETVVLFGSLLYLLMGVSLVAMSVAVYPVVRKFSPSAAIAYFGVRLLEGVVDIIIVLSMLALAGLGRDYIAAGSPNDSYFQVAGGLLLRVQEWAGHVILDVAVFPLGALLLYWVFFRTRLVPRWLSGWGLLGAVLYWAAGVLVMFHVIVPMQTPHIMLEAPLGLQEMVLAIWLIAKGFSVPGRHLRGVVSRDPPDRCSP